MGRSIIRVKYTLEAAGLIIAPELSIEEQEQLRSTIPIHGEFTEGTIDGQPATSITLLGEFAVDSYADALFENLQEYFGHDT